MMKRQDKLLRILMSTAAGVIVFSLAVILILHFTSVDKKPKKHSSSETTETKKDDKDNKNEDKDNSKKAKSKKSGYTQVITEKNESDKKSENNKENNKENTKENHKEKTEEKTNNVNNSEVFDTQAEAHEYGKKEMERLVRETGKYTEYAVKGVRDENGQIKGWTVEIYQKDKKE